uniref:Zinc finger CCCH domain-containing protein 65-like isoform X3 n=1 Tax=Cymbidium ensifolium TaxID=78740 RepID=A0A5J6N9L9_CYMEN|nr:zinc finger CCCH domain-containing protein 65-like isoform X3 [Cymbidium ensifolium]
MGLLSLFKNLNFGFGMPHTPSTTSASTMQAKEFKGMEQGNKLPLVGDHHEITGVEKDTRIKSDEIGSCTYGMDWKFNYPSRKGDRGLGNVASLENAGQIECKVNFLGLPIRPGEKNCPFYMRTGGCKFASRCWFHHPDPIAVVGDVLQDRKNGAPSQHHGPVEQLCETRRPSENTSSEQTAFLGPFTPNRGVQQNVHWIGNPTTTSLLHPQETNINDQRKTLANKDIGYEFSGVELQQFEEYPQRPSEPQCQYFMKTGSCKFKSACRFHHPKPNLSVQASPLKSMAASPLHPPPPETNKNEKDQELANKDTAHEFNGGVKSQQFDEYPQRPGEPECQHFMKTGYCKFKSACRCHHPKSNLSFPARRRKPDKPICTHFSRSGICKFGSACRFSHHIEHI